MKLFIKYLRAQLGMPYVWGGQGDLLTGLHDPEKWIKSQESNADNRKRAIDFFRKCKEAGMDPIRAFDCSGLIMYFLQDLHGVMGDRSAQMLYNQSAKISREELQEGDLVFKGSAPDSITHVGVYVGGGRVIESKGRDDGVCETELASRPFKYFGRLAALAPFLVDEPDEPDEPYVFKLTSPRQKGEAVKELQRFLNFIHIRDANGEKLVEDGIFGPKTEYALISFAVIYAPQVELTPVPGHTLTLDTEPFCVTIDGIVVFSMPEEGGEDA